MKYYTICREHTTIELKLSNYKYKYIRAALSWNVEIAELARLHNNANVVSIPARFVSLEEAIAIVDIFVSTEFEGGRHKRRIDKMTCQ